MKNVKTRTSRNYHDFLIESLCDMEEIAAYIETVLEDGNDEPRLLSQVLSNVMEAYQKMNKTNDLALYNYQKLQQILAHNQGAEIFAFSELLTALGLEISLKVKK